MVKNFIPLFKFIWFYSLNVTNCLVSLWIVISFQISIGIIKPLITSLFANRIKLITSSGMMGACGDWYS